MFLLRTDQSVDSNVTLEDFVVSHRSCLRYAYDETGEHTKNGAEYTKISIIQRFLLEIFFYIRNRQVTGQVTGRNKIQNSFNSNMFIITHISENTVTVDVMTIFVQ